MAIPTLSRPSTQKSRTQLLLPMTAILETGNHIGQNGDGAMRRAAALRFVERTGQALRGETPFQTTPMVDKEQLIAMLAEFPNWAGRNDARGKGSGLGDLTIHGEWNQLCKRMPERRIYIWSLDDQLAAYDHLP